MISRVEAEIDGQQGGDHDKDRDQSRRRFCLVQLLALFCRVLQIKHLSCAVPFRWRGLF